MSSTSSGDHLERRVKGQQQCCAKLSFALSIDKNGTHTVLLPLPVQANPYDRHTNELIASTRPFSVCRDLPVSVSRTRQR
jgi:hypothetical protein